MRSLSLRNLLFLGLALACAAAAQTCSNCTTVTDTLFTPSGGPATTALTISWPTFTASDGHVVISGTLRVPVTNGALSVPLEPNAGATPTGSYYFVTYATTPGPILTRTEYWVVPATGTANLSAVRVLTPPTPGLSVALSQLAQGGATNGQVPTWNGSSYVPETPSGGVQSVFGRNGAVVAVSGDYTAAEVTNAVDQTSTYSNPTWLTALAWSKITGAPTFLQSANNLSDLGNAGSARSNLGLGSAAIQNTGAFAQTANNLSDLGSASAARTNLGLGSSATQNTSVFAQVGNNLSDLASASSARTNLGLAAVASSGSASDLASGTLPNARLPFPSATALGGVESIAAVSHNFLTAISTLGVVSQAQPACADLTNSAASCSTDATNASNLSAGTIPAARLSSANLPTISLTGNVTGSASGGSIATTIANLAVTNAMLAGSIAASKLVGTDIATLGTVTAGTWNGTPIGNAYLANSASTVNGQACTLGLTCTVTVSISSGVTGLASGMAAFLGNPGTSNLPGNLLTLNSGSGVQTIALADGSITKQAGFDFVVGGIDIGISDLGLGAQILRLGSGQSFGFFGTDSGSTKGYKFVAGTTISATPYLTVSYNGHTTIGNSTPTLTSGGGGTGATLSTPCADQSCIVSIGSTVGTGAVVITFGAAYTNAPPCDATDETSSSSINVKCTTSAGVGSGTYTSGITATGSSTQTCTLTITGGGGSGATATVALTGTNTIAANTALVITAAGSAFISAPTSATVSSGTATCSGTATIATALSTTGLTLTSYSATSGSAVNFNSGDEVQWSIPWAR